MQKRKNNNNIVLSSPETYINGDINSIEGREDIVLLSS